MGRLLVLLLMFWLFSLGATAEPAYITFPADVDWVTQSSDHFDVLFRRGRDDLGARALRAAERARTVLAPLFPDIPERVWILLADFNDNLNGYALDILYPHMVIFASPPEPSSELATLDDWFSSVILHELTHNLHLYPAHGVWAPLRAIFGSFAAPNGLMPSHFHEGLAVFTETHFTRSGRGKSPYFSMLRRMAVAEKKWGTDGFFSVDQMDGGALTWPFGTTSYFMGWNLYRELWGRKGAEGVHNFVDNTSRILPFFLNHSYREIYGEDYQTIWDKIFSDTRLMEEMEIERIKTTPLSLADPVTTSQFSKRDLHLSPGGTLAVFRSYSPTDGGQFEIWDLLKKEKFDPGTSSKIHSLDGKIGGSEGICWNESETQLMVVIQKYLSGYTTDEIDLIDWKTGESTPVTLQGRPLTHVRSLACSDTFAKIVVYLEHGTEGEVVILSLDPTHTQLTREQSWKNPSGTWASGLVMHGGKIWIALRRGIQTDFYSWTGDSPKLVQTADGHFHSLRPLDSDAFLAIGQNDGRDEIWIVDPTRNTIQKHAAVLGGVSSFDWKQKSLYALNFHHGGYDLEKLTPISVPSRKLGVDKKADSPEMPPISASASSEYSPIGSLTPKTFVPLFIFVPSGFQVGLWIPGFDISQRHFFDLIAGYDSRGSYLADLGYSYRKNRSVWTAGTGYFPTYFFYSNGKIKLARGSASLTHSYNLFEDDNRLLRIKSSAIASQLSQVFQLDAPYPDASLNSVGAGLELNYLVGIKRKPLFVSPSSGTALSLGLSYFPTVLGSTEEYSKVIAVIDQYLPSIINQHSIYLTLKGGWTHGTKVLNSFFEVGGEFTFSPYRPLFHNRGFLPFQFAAREVVNFTVEYRFPLLQIYRGYGLFPLKLKRIHAAIVSDFSTVDVSADSSNRLRMFKDVYASSGIELKTDWVTSYYLPTQLRLGLYHGYGDLGQPLYFSLALEASL